MHQGLVGGRCGHTPSYRAAARGISWCLAELPDRRGAASLSSLMHQGLVGGRCGHTPSYRAAARGISWCLAELPDRRGAAGLSSLMHERLVARSMRPRAVLAQALPLVVLVLAGSCPRRTPTSNRPRRRGCASRSGRGTSGRARSRARCRRTRAALPPARATSRRRDRSTARRAAARCRPSSSVAARCSRPRSPPDSAPTILLLVRPLEVEAAKIRARGHLEAADGEDVLAVGDRLPDRLVVGQRLARLVDDRELHGVADR